MGLQPHRLQFPVTGFCEFVPFQNGVQFPAGREKRIEERFNCRIAYHFVHDYLIGVGSRREWAGMNGQANDTGFLLMIGLRFRLLPLARHAHNG